MLSALDGAAVYLACGSTDLRKSIDGLAAIVSYTFELDLFSNSLFVFCNRGHDKLKILSPRGYPGPQRLLALLPPSGARPLPLAC
jgi:transposase